MPLGEYKQVAGAYTMEWNETMQQAANPRSPSLTLRP